MDHVEKRRLFVALVLPEEGQILLDRWSREVQGRSIRKVAKGNFHITLQFLGDVPSLHIPKIEEVLSRAAQRYSPFVVTVKGAGGFPAPSAARVWFYTVEATPKLFDLAKTVRHALTDLGYHDPKTFHPHITFARVKGKPQPVPIRETGAYTWTITEILLMQSILHPRGPRYIPLKRFPLEV